LVSCTKSVLSLNCFQIVFRSNLPHELLVYPEWILGQDDLSPLNRVPMALLATRPPSFSLSRFFATLTKTPGVEGNSSQIGNLLRFSFTLLHESENYLISFLWFAHSCTKHPGCTLVFSHHSALATCRSPLHLDLSQLPHPCKLSPPSVPLGFSF
jgi:hypothetical protein